MPTLGELLAFNHDAPRSIPGVPVRNMSVPQVAGDVGATIMSFLDGMKARQEAAAAETATGARAGERFRRDDDIGGPPPQMTSPNLLRQPAPLPGIPARGNAELQGFTGMQQPPLSAFDVYGAPVPTRRPLDLGAMFFGGPEGQSETPSTPERGERVPLPERKNSQASAVATPPAAPPLPSRANGGSSVAATGAGRPGSVPIQGAPQTGTPFQQSAPLFDPLTQKFLLQTGLSLMVPRWGGPMSNIGQALGEGGEAVTRTQEAEDQKKLTDKKLQLEQARIDKMGSGRRGATESSRSKRVKEKSPMQALAADLSPEASIFLQQRMKQLNKLAADEDGEGGDAAAQFDSIMAETRRVDARARGTRGQMRSEEIQDTFVARAATDPNVERQVLALVGSDATQKALMQARINAAKGATVSGGKQPTR